MKIRLIGDLFTCRGFGMAGVETVVAEGEQQIKEEFQNALEAEELAILFITEKKADEIRNQLEEQKMERKFPLIVEIPDKEGWQDRGKVLKLINRTLSIDV